MMDKIEYMASHLPDVLQARWEANHAPEMAIGGIAVVYCFVSIFIGSIWSGGHGGSVTIEEKPFAFWSCIFVYVVLGCWLLLYL